MRLTSLVACLVIGLLGAVPEKPAWRVSFFPSDGAPVKMQELKATVNGVPARVARMTGDQEPLVLLVVLDLAGDLSLVDPAREALIAEIANLPPQVSVALLRAQDGLRVLDDPGTSRMKLAKTIRELAISGRAGLLETINSVVLLADSMLVKTRVRTAVLYVSDSLITNYREDYTNPVVNSSDSNDMSRRFPEGLVKEKVRQLRSELVSTLSPVFLVHLNYQSDRLNEAYQTGLLDLSAASGGRAVFCRSVGEIPSAVTETLERLIRLQSVDLEVKPSRARQWELSLESPGRQLQYRIHYQPAREK